MNQFLDNMKEIEEIYKLEKNDYITQLNQEEENYSTFLKKYDKP